MRDSLEKKFISHDALEDMEEKIFELRAEISYQSDNKEKEMLKIKEEMVETFKYRIDSLLEETFRKYDRVEKSFSKFFNSDELEVNFARKANVEVVESLDAEKASRTELSVVQDRLDDLSSRLKHVAVLQREITLGLKPIHNSIGPFETQQKRVILSKMNQIQQHTEILNNWINDG